MYGSPYIYKHSSICISTYLHTIYMMIQNIKWYWWYYITLIDFFPFLWNHNILKFFQYWLIKLIKRHTWFFELFNEVVTYMIYLFVFHFKSENEVRILSNSIQLDRWVIMSYLVTVSIMSEWKTWYNYTDILNFYYPSLVVCNKLHCKGENMLQLLNMQTHLALLINHHQIIILLTWNSTLRYHTPSSFHKQCEH